ncbi:MAG: patatin-like phospholipase family protein [Candidatus Paracaedibacteraceae bacterium]|nr:patatin-like phospholipase family protein [Candidatus Paracaedibacteraceae bacterium]
MLKFVTHLGRLGYIIFILLSVTIAEEVDLLSFSLPSSHDSTAAAVPLAAPSYLAKLSKLATQLENLEKQYVTQESPCAISLEELKIKLSRKIQKYAKNYEATLRSTNPSNKLRILSLDGGAIRGFLECIFLSYLTHLTEKPIHELFDMIIATSTGTLIAAGLATEKPENYQSTVSLEDFMPYRESIKSPYYTPEELAAIYLEDGPIIFSSKNSCLRAWMASWLGERMGSWVGGALDPWLGLWWGPKYKDTDLNKTLEKFFGDKTLKDLKLPVFLTAYDLDNKKIITFSTLRPQDSTEKNVFIYDALSACVAAPTMFAPKKILRRNTCDAGIFLNNPAELGLNLATQYCKTPPDQIILLSLGCGYNTDSKDTQTYKEMGLKGWMGEIMNTACDGQRTHNSISQRQQLTNLPHSYLRLTPLLESKDMQMDSTDAQDFKTWSDAAKKELLLRKDDINRLVEQLTDKKPSIDKQQTSPLKDLPSIDNEKLLLTGDREDSHTSTAIATDAGSSSRPSESLLVSRDEDQPQRPQIERAP